MFRCIGGKGIGTGLDEVVHSGEKDSWVMAGVVVVVGNAGASL